MGERSDNMDESTFKFEAPSGTRLHRYFYGIEVQGMWWSYEDKKWGGADVLSNGNCSSSAPCKTLAAFKSHVRRHKADISGHQARLLNRFRDYDITTQVE